MPELPEVEIYKRYFARHALGEHIERVAVRDERILGTIRKEKFVRQLKGRSFSGVRRHGKHLFADTGATWLHLHFGMSGDLTYFEDGEAEPRFARIVFGFSSGGNLAFEDMRLFGLAELIASPDEYIADKGLGPDPLDRSFTFTRFAERLERRRGGIKALLMGQEVVAGLGNLYTDEVLYQTSIHPRRDVADLHARELRSIFTSMRRILKDVIARRERGVDLPPRYLTRNRVEGERCPRCGGTIRRGVVFGRTTYFCGRHQK